MKEKITKIMPLILRSDLNRRITTHMINAGVDNLLKVNSSSMEAPVLVSAAMGGTMGYANDAIAALSGIPVGGMYHNQGLQRIRVV